MAVLGILLVLGVIAVNCALAYMALQIAIGIWFPARATDRQRAWVRAPAIQVFYPFVKWMSPIMAMILPMQVLVMVVRLSRLVAG